MAKEKLSIFELKEIISSYYDGCEYIVNDYQKDNYGQPSLSVRKEPDGNIYAFINEQEGEFCLCQIS